MDEDKTINTEVSTTEEKKPKKSAKKKTKAKTASKKKKKSSASAVKKASPETTKPPVKKESKPEPEKTKPKKSAATFSSAHKKKSGGIGVYLFLIVLFLLVIVGGTIYQSKLNSNESVEETDVLREDLNNEVSSLKSKLQGVIEQMEEEKQNSDKQQLSVYENQELGIRFSYPAELGDFTDDIDQRIDPANPEIVHQLVYITFSANPDISLNIATADFPNEEGLLYTGTEETLTALCENPLAVSETGYCDLIEFAGQASVERAFVVRNESSSLVLMQSLLNLPETSNYQGLVLQANLGSPPLSGRNLFAPSDESSEEEAITTFLRNVIKREGLSLVVMQNLKVYKTIRENFELIAK